MIKNYIIGAVVAAIAIAGVFLPVGSDIVGSWTGYNSINLKPNQTDSYAVGINNVSVISTSGVVLSQVYATTSWNPGSVGTTSVNAAATSTDIALPGAVMGDYCFGSLTSATSSAASIHCFITGTATATLRLLNLGSTALDLATGTAKVSLYR